MSWRAIAIALVSTIVVSGAPGLVVINAPGWSEVQPDFLNGPIFWSSLPGLVAAFGRTSCCSWSPRLLILPFGLVIAVMRGLPGPVFFPVRVLATVYVDIFRALPSILVIFILGFGVPGLAIDGVPGADPNSLGRRRADLHLRG